uniref:Uncharacterized protein n=1 Tax=Helianthus annuus TaxID=4232 RepID=A0A251T577_HELAN
MQEHESLQHHCPVVGPLHPTKQDPQHTIQTFVRNPHPCENMLSGAVIDDGFIMGGSLDDCGFYTRVAKHRPRSQIGSEKTCSVF